MTMLFISILNLYKFDRLKIQGFKNGQTSKKKKEFVFTITMLP